MARWAIIERTLVLFDSTLEVLRFSILSVTRKSTVALVRGVFKLAKRFRT